MPTLLMLHCSKHEIRAKEVVQAAGFWHSWEEESDNKCKQNKNVCVTISIKFDPKSKEKDAPTHSARIKCFKTGAPEEHC